MSSAESTRPRIWSIVVVIIVGLLLAMLPRESHAAATALPLLQSSTLDQSNEPSSYSLAASDFLQAQTFTAGRSGLLDRVELLGTRNPSGGASIPIQITAVDGSGRPTGPVLGSGSLNDNQFSGTQGVWASVGIEPVVPVIAGVKYAIVKPNGSPSWFFWAIAGDTYSGGQSVQFTLLQDIDFAFRTYVGPNTAPVASDDSYTTNEDTLLTGSVLSNDSDVDSTPLTAVKVSDPAHGDLTLNSDGSFTYTPNANFFGTDSFTYKANDGIDDSDVATVTITVNAVNDAPTATNDSYSTDEDTALTMNAPGVLSNDSDIDSTTLTAIKVAGPAHGTLTLNADGSFTYTPAANYNGPDSFTYKANDGSADSNIATVNLTVNAVNDVPTIAVAASGECRSDISGLIKLTLSDVDSSNLTLSATSSNTNLVPLTNVVFGGSGTNRSATITTVRGKTGSATITITVSDGQLISTTTVRVQAGGNGNDTVTGTDGADLIFGQNGDDTLNGKAGNDVLCGGLGNDTLQGDAGADSFDGGKGTDRVTDFKSSEGDTKVNIP
jgi:VCBS repeat-containing protein